MEYILHPTESVVHDGYSVCQESEKYIFISSSTCWDALYAWRSKEGAGNVNSVLPVCDGKRAPCPIPPTASEHTHINKA